MRQKPSDLYQNIIQSIEEEIEIIKEGGGGRKVLLQDGQLIKKSTLNSIYKFKSDNLFEIPDDSPVEVSLNDSKAHGNVLSIEGNKISLALDTYLGEIISEAWLEVNPYYLLEVLRDKYKLIEKNDHKYNISLSDKAFDFVPYNKTHANINSLEKTSLNSSQVNAVNFAIGSDVSFIWGPPGTGKTTTLTEISKYFLDNNKSVLITSHTNIAIDNALNTISNKLDKENNPYLNNGAILRFGAHQLDDLHEKVTIDYWLGVKSVELNREKNDLSLKISELDTEIKNLKQFQEIVLRINGINNKIVENDEKIEQIETIITKNNQFIQSKLTEIKNIHSDLKKYEELSGLKRRIYANKINNIKLELSQKNQAINDSQSELDDVGNEKISIQNETEANNNKLDELMQQYNSFSSYLGKFRNTQEILDKINENKNSIGVFQERLKEINSKLEELEISLIKEAKIVGTTLTKTYINNVIDERMFDVIIIDEASTASIPLIYLAIAHANTKVVVVGDFKQLSPISHSNNYYLSNSIFEDANITDKSIDSDKRLVMLNTQHRMEPEIANLINDLVYDGRLKNGKISNKNVFFDIEELNEQPVCMIDTTDFSPYCTTTKSYSRINVYSANIALTLAVLASNDNLKTLIITPYKAQARLINNLIDQISDKSLMNYSKYISASTIHRAQGLESDLVIIDFVDGFGSRVSKLMKGGYDSDTMRLFNVATTRAKSKVIYIGDSNYLSANLKDFSLDFFNLVNKKSKIIKSSKIIDIDYQELINDENIQDNLSVYTEKTYYDKLIVDLEKTTKDLVIVSPFITEKRIKFFESIFESLILRGVTIKVITDNTAEQSLTHRLKSIGIEVITYGNIHEKFVYIDQRIAFTGSLNTLSQNTTKEMMLRFTSKKILDQIIRSSNIYQYIERKQKNDHYATYDIGMCDVCRSQMVVKESRFGLFGSCKNYPTCKHSRNLTDDEILDILGADFFKCSLGHSMEIRRSKNGSFVGCTMYPEHKETKSLRLPEVS